MYSSIYGGSQRLHCVLLYVYDSSMYMTGECLWLDLDLIARVMKDIRNLFPVTRYAYTTIPTYTCGQIGMVVASKDKVCWSVITFQSCHVIPFVVDMYNVHYG